MKILAFICMSSLALTSALVAPVPSDKSGRQLLLLQPYQHQNALFQPERSQASIGNQDLNSLQQKPTESQPTVGGAQPAESEQETPGKETKPEVKEANVIQPIVAGERIDQNSTQVSPAAGAAKLEQLEPEAELLPGAKPEPEQQKPVAPPQLPLLPGGPPYYIVQQPHLFGQTPHYSPLPNYRPLQNFPGGEQRFYFVGPQPIYDANYAGVQGIQGIQNSVFLDPNRQVESLAGQPSLGFPKFGVELFDGLRYNSASVEQGPDPLAEFASAIAAQPAPFSAPFPSPFQAALPSSFSAALPDSFPAALPGSFPAPLSAPLPDALPAPLSASLPAALPFYGYTQPAQHNFGQVYPAHQGPAPLQFSQFVNLQQRLGEGAGVVAPGVGIPILSQLHNAPSLRYGLQFKGGPLHSQNGSKELNRADNKNKSSDTEIKTLESRLDETTVTPSEAKTTAASSELRKQEDKSAEQKDNKP